MIIALTTCKLSHLFTLRQMVFLPEKICQIFDPLSLTLSIFMKLPKRKELILQWKPSRWEMIRGFGLHNSHLTPLMYLYQPRTSRTCCRSRLTSRVRNRKAACWCPTPYQTWGFLCPTRSDWPPSPPTARGTTSVESSSIQNVRRI